MIGAITSLNTFRSIGAGIEVRVVLVIEVFSVESFKYK